MSPYLEVVAALDRLASAGRMCIILSNGSPSMLHAAVSDAGLAERCQAVVSVDALRSYKPDPRVYQLGVDPFGGPADRILFVSSNGWDAAGHVLSAYASRGSTVPKRRQNVLASWPTSLSLTSPPLSPASDRCLRDAGLEPMSCLAGGVCCVCNRRLAHLLPHGCNVMPTVEDQPGDNTRSEQ
jgi:hypothetical protein